MSYTTTATTLTLSAMLCACGGPAQVDLEAERAALRAAASSYHAAASVLDTAALEKLYRDDSLVLAPGEETVAGIAAVRDFIAAFASTPGLAVRTDDAETLVDVGAGGDMGYTLADVTLEVTGPDGLRLEQSLRDFHLWKKQDGVWKVAVDIWNADSAAGAQAAGSEADRAAIADVSQRELAAFSAGDRAAIAALFTDDAVIMPPDEPGFAGSAAREAWLSALYAAFSLEGAYGDRSVVIVGDLAYETLDFVLTLTPVDGGEAVTEDGKGLHIYRRQPDGSWKIVVDIWNADA